MNLFRQIFLYLRFVVRRLVDDRCLTVAGSLTYTSLLALVPVFTVALTLASKVPATQQFIAQLKGFIFKSLVPDAAGRVVSVYLEQFANNAARLTVIGLAMIIVTAVALLFTIDSAFNDIWRTRNRRSWWKRLAAYLLLLILGPLLIGASLSMTSYMLHLSHDFDRVLPMFDDVVLKLVPFLLTAGALILAYRIIPNRYVPARHALAGGLFAALLFELTKHLFVTYVVNMPTYSLVYGAFASVPIFLAWLFCCWIVVLIGAEVTATFSYFRHPHAQYDDPLSRYRAARIMIDAMGAERSGGMDVSTDAGSNHLTDHRSNQTAGRPMSFSALRSCASMPIDQLEDILECLVKAKIVVQQNAGGQLCYYLPTAQYDVGDDEIRLALTAVSHTSVAAQNQ